MNRPAGFSVAVAGEAAWLRCEFPNWHIEWASGRGWVAHRDGVPGIVVRSVAPELAVALRRIDRWPFGR